jgi:hypothetical protein
VILKACDLRCAGAPIDLMTMPHVEWATTGAGGAIRGTGSLTFSSVATNQFSSVVVIAPGHTATEMTDVFLDSEEKRQATTSRTHGGVSRIQMTWQRRRRFYCLAC